MNTVRYFSLLSLMLCLIISSCNTDNSGLAATQIGYKNLAIGDSFEKVLRTVPYIQPASDEVAKKLELPKGYKEYHAIKEPAFEIERVRFAPSTFFRFDDKNELVLFKIYFLVENPKEKLTPKDAIRRLDKNQVKGLLNLFRQKGQKLKTSADIVRELEIDTEGTGYFTLVYRVRKDSHKYQ